MSKMQQHNPYLKRRRSRPQDWLLRVLVPCLVVIGFGFVYINMRILGASDFRKDVTGRSPSTYPQFQERSAPPFAGSAIELRRWADPPDFGSFQYSATSAIHFPSADLQALHDAVKMVGATPTAFMQHKMTPDSDFSLLTRKGNKVAASNVGVNQDRCAIISPFLEDGGWWLGLFDGHGMEGEVVSQIAVSEFPKQLHQRIRSTTPQKDVVDQLRQTVLRVHEQMRPLPASGTTGISMLKIRDLLYITNVGDSEAIVFAHNAAGDVEIVYETKPHKPHLPQERARIEAAGGMVAMPPMPGFSSRLVINLPGGVQMGLAMSRSMGDVEADNVGHTCEPTTDVLNLAELKQTRKNWEFTAIAASDGLFDRVSFKNIATEIARTLRQQKGTMLETSEQLIMRSSELWATGGDFYRDDISIVVHNLRL